MKVARTERVLTRLTPKELKRLQKHADKMHMTKSTYIQFLVNRHQPVRGCK